MKSKLKKVQKTKNETKKSEDKFDFNFFVNNIVKQQPILHRHDDDNILNSVNENRIFSSYETTPIETKQELPVTVSILNTECKKKQNQKLQDTKKIAKEEHINQSMKECSYSFESSFENQCKFKSESFQTSNKFQFKKLANQSIKKLDNKKNLKNYFVKKYQLDQEKQHQCKICNKKFRNPTALGGHMSRSHPNMSVDYKIRCNRMLLYKGEKVRKKFIQKSCKQIFYF